MSAKSQTAPALDTFATFGALLRYLRRAKRLTQRDLAIATGYSEGQICRLEQNQRLPDLTALAALFVPALELYDDPAMVARLVELAAGARHDKLIDSSVAVTTSSSETREVVGALEAPPHPPAALIERSALVALIRERLAEERCVVLYGLPGSGKTTLAAAVAAHESEPVFWLTLTEHVNATSEALIRQIALFLLASGDDDAGSLLPRSGEPRLAFDQQVALLGQGLSRLADQSAEPVLVCLDNAHAVGADPAVLQTLNHLSATAPLRLLLTSREMLGLRKAAHVAVPGFDPTEASALITRLMPGLDARLAGRLLERTAGNPMLLRLTLGHLGVAGDDPAAFIDRLEAQPEIAHYMSESLLQHLSADGRLTAGLLAVLRHPADLHDELLIELLQSIKPDYALGLALADLQRRYLINTPRQAGLHPLIHDHLYVSLAADLPGRRTLHRLAAEWSEAGGDLVESAYHYGRAGELRRAADVLADQAQSLVNQGQAQVGITLIDDLLASLRRPRSTRRETAAAIERTLRQVRGDLLMNLGSTEAAEADYQAAFELSNSAQVRAHVAWRMAHLLLQSGRPAAALDLVRESGASLAPVDTMLRMRLSGIEAAALVVLGQHAAADVAARQVLAAADHFDLHRAPLFLPTLAQAYNILAVLAHMRQDIATALERWRQALQASQRAGLRQIVSRCQINLGIASFQAGQIDEALDYCNQALAGLQIAGDTYFLARLQQNLGSIHTARGDLAQAQAAFEAACDLKRHMGDSQSLLLSQIELAHTLLMRGDLAAGEALCAPVVAALPQITEVRTRAHILGTASEFALLRGEIAAAEQMIAEAVLLPGISNDRRMGYDFENRRALLLLTAARAGEAAMLEDDVPLEFGHDIHLERLLLRALAALADGDRSAVERMLAEVRERAERSGFRYYLLPAARIAAAARRSAGAIDRAELPWIFWHGEELSRRPA